MQSRSEWQSMRSGMGLDKSDWPVQVLESVGTKRQHHYVGSCQEANDGTLPLSLDNYRNPATGKYVAG
jgi:hypothetical protein